ncbi:ABC transporter ATP-binding protein [Bradymonadaceae bacterium TMQ3]|nr:ABC transporter ATP-binding protein [Bradymonadaceae bacterium TMQ3]TXC77296.1 ABC transporter ATP-binding protein [Bradymonadales bacterium TMQ1]
MPPRSPTTVTLRDVSRAFGRTYALHRVNTTLTSGSITALLGNNGAGKSTLLNILATVDAPSDGEVRFGKVAFRDFARRGRARIGWVSHQTLVYDELTGRENLTFFGQLYGIPRIETITEEWLRRVDLNGAADRPVGTYSRGMKQRLTIARALLHDPQLVLLDEPATGLDQAGTALVSALLGELRDEGRIVVIISHNFSLIETLADNVLILRKGQLRASGPLPSGTSLISHYQAHA